MIQKDNNGQALLVATVLIFVIFALNIVLLDNVIQTTKVNRVSRNEIAARYAAEAGIEKAVWCMNQTSGGNCGGQYGGGYTGETDVFVGDAAFTTTVTGANYDREITSVGTYNDKTVTLNAALTKAYDSVEVEYRYGMLLGGNGLIMDNNSFITGDVFSNGNASCVTAEITGDIRISGTHEINGCSVVGDVRSSAVNNSTVNGDAYYQTIVNSTISGTAYPGTPPPDSIDFPITQAMMDQWKADASDGSVISGDYQMNDNESMGPVKITGNLSIKSNKILTLTGVVYVQGDLNVQSNVTVKLDPSFQSNSGVIIVDGEIIFDSNGVFQGTVEGGHMIFLSLSNAAPAVSVKAGSGRAILYAPNGEVLMKSNCNVIQATGDKVHLESNARLVYDPLLVSSLYLSDSAQVPTTWEYVPGSRAEE